MKSISFVKSLLVATILPMFLFSCDKHINTQTHTDPVVAPADEGGDIIPGQYIVYLKESVVAPGISYLQGPINDRDKQAEFMLTKQEEITGQLQAFLSDANINANQVIAYYTSVVAGFAIKLSDEEHKQLAANDKIDLIQFDRIETLPDFEVESIDASGARSQTTPCGVTNAGGTRSHSSGYWAWIIDTGIDLDHPDLNVASAPSAASFAGGTPDDCHGHGTHVAGTLGAINNNIGVVGVANGALVVPVKVFSACTGNTSTSTILSGINHVGQRHVAGDVVNLSLGGYYGSTCSSNTPYKTPLTNMGNFGVRIAIAAGNNYGQDAALYQPACVNGTNIYTVAAMNCDKTWGSLSNLGRPPVDYIATGISVYSTYKNGGYATLNGTSMATPHVAGIMQVKQAGPGASGHVAHSGAYYPIASH